MTPCWFSEHLCKLLTESIACSKRRVVGDHSLGVAVSDTFVQCESGRCLHKRFFKHALNPAILALAENPRPPGCLKLSGEESLWRIRVGDYRVVYQVQDAVLLVLVVKLGHRREIYR